MTLVERGNLKFLWSGVLRRGEEALESLTSSLRRCANDHCGGVGALAIERVVQCCSDGGDVIFVRGTRSVYDLAQLRSMQWTLNPNHNRNLDRLEMVSD